MKKILLISQNFYPEIGSAANRMKQLFRLFHEKYDVTMYTTAPHYPNRAIYEQEEFWEEDFEEEAVYRIETKIQQYEANLFFRFLLYLETFCRFIVKIMRTKDHFDVIYVSSPPISVALVGLIAKKRLKAKLIVDIRDLWPESFKGVGKFNSRFFLFFAYQLEKSIYRKADEIIVNSERFATYIKEQGYGTAKITFIPNALTNEELEIGNQDVPIEKEKMTVIYTGNIGLAQELTSFIRMAAFFQNNAHVQFKVIGYGMKFQKLIEAVEKKHLTNVVIKPPETRQQVMEDLMNADIAFVGLAPHKAFELVIPGKVIDYMGFGLPIIGIASGYCKDVVNGSNTGFIYEHSNEEKMYQALKHLLENRVLCREIRQNAQRYARNNYCWEANFKQIEEIIAGFE
ncbi:glycosyltransferase family 4 protein [Listeria costaricensis]|uniref:glycosyltransferase family 4 protein n=1 Tax=Listeria costaricensis TaxID=2026604 RepID=UPI000C07BFD7|nr:glycosyltransferase family 4 protein [Listeria costaricensis]